MKKEAFNACRIISPAYFPPTDSGWKFLLEPDQVRVVYDAKEVIVAGSGTPPVLTRGEYRDFPYSPEEARRRRQTDLPLPSDLRALRERGGVEAARIAAHRSLFEQAGKLDLHQSLKTKKGIMAAIVDGYDELTGRQGEALPRTVVSVQNPKAITRTMNDLLSERYVVGVSLCSVRDPWMSGRREEINSAAVRKQGSVREGLKYWYPILNCKEAERAHEEMKEVYSIDKRIRELIITGHPFWRGWWGKTQNRHTAMRAWLRQDGIVVEMAVGSYHTRDIGRLRLRREPRRGIVNLFAPWLNLEKGILGSWQHGEGSPQGAWWHQDRQIVANAKATIDLILEEFTGKERFQAFLLFAEKTLMAGYDMFEFLSVHTDIQRKKPKLGGLFLYQIDGPIRL